MLRITENTSSDGAKKYYTQGLVRSDYYTQGADAPGFWHGRGAQLLGLSGEVTREPFFALCDNRDPRSGSTLTARQKSGRRVGYDFTFSCPKSVSLLYGLTGDPRLRAAFVASVDATMREIEQEMQARVRKGGVREGRTTGNMVWADFVHGTTRPVDGTPDPDLHCHCFAFNATWDAVEGRWKAGEFGDIKRDAAYFEAAFHARLAHAVKDLGYGIERHGKWWDIAGLPRPLLEKFSRRTAEIEEVAAELGITDADAKAALGARTRDRKSTEFDETELRKAWKERLSVTERLVIERVLANDGGGASAFVETMPEQAVDHAVGVAFERASVTSEKHLRELALRRGFGDVLPEWLARPLTAAGVLTRDIEGRRLVTTRGVLAEERAMLGFARAGRGVCRPLGRAGFTPAAGLTVGQQGAVEHVLGSRDRVVMVQGGAGTGKTTLMREVARGLAEAGRQLFAFAPSAEAARGVLRREGFADAETVARLLVDERLQQRVRGQVWLIDEAGLLGVRTLRSLFDLAGKLEARLILTGDTRQHAAVERGDALRLLIERAGLPVADMREIVRQQGAYREAVEAIGRRDIAEGIATLDRLGWITEMTGEDRHKRLAADYLEALRQGRSALVVSPTHREGDQVTALIREALKRDGRIGAIDAAATGLRLLSWTTGERGDAASYRPGLVVQFVRDAPGIGKGERLTVSAVEGGTVGQRKADGTVCPLPLGHAERFGVFEPFTLGLAAGDRVRVTRNGWSADGRHRLNNGSVHTVEKLTEEGDILLTNGWRIGREFGHLAHGYTATSHASQGSTVDRVLIAQGAQSGAAGSVEQLYVSVSRGREGVRIYTDDRAALLASVARSHQRGSALELADGEVGKRRMQPRRIEERLRAAAERVRKYRSRQEAETAAELQPPERWREKDARSGPDMER